MTREQLEELAELAARAPGIMRLRDFKQEAGAANMRFLEAAKAALPRLLLEKERAVKALKWESENGEGLSRKSAEVLAFVEEEA